MDAISCLAPPPAALLATSFADAAIARALHFSSSTITVSPDSSSSSSLSHHHRHSPLLGADLPSSYYYPHPHPPPPLPPPHAAATCCDSLLVADSPRRRSSPTTAAPRLRKTHHQHNQALAPAGARAGKRRSRASKRAPTTYISTDAANFRLMVQQITGVQADGADVAGVDMAAMLQATAALDAAALLGLRAAAAGNGNGNGNPQLLPVPGDESSAAALRQQQLLELQQQPCFPTLDSWNVMCETNSAEML